MIDKLTYEQIQNLKYKVERWYRIKYCQAWFGDVYINGYKYVIIKSYDTIVAFESVENKILYSVGRFSMTTYQHIRKYRDNYSTMLHNTKEINLELCNWF